jgi:RNA polymerase sigma factor (sigma-70 family)
MKDDPTSNLLRAYVEGGSQDAASQLFERYAERLIRLASAKMSKQLQRKVDPDDVVQSAFRSFFVRAQKGDCTVTKPGDLWGLLVAFTYNKIRKQVQHYAAQRRDYRREHGLSDEGVAILRSAPSAQAAAILIEELRRFLAAVKPEHRRILELYLQGNSYTAISAETKWTTTRVGQIVREYQKKLLKQCGGDRGE